jgi:hypothetical protein
MTHANTMFLRHDFTIYFHVFEFIQLLFVNLRQNNIGSIDAGQNSGIRISEILKAPTQVSQ